MYGSKLLTFYKGGNASKPFKIAPNLQSKAQKVRIYFGSSKFHHKFRAKREKDREKEVFVLGSVFEACMNDKIIKI